MLFFIIALLVLCFFRIKIYSPINKDACNEVFLDRTNTTTINGIFVILVFIAHFSSYLKSYYSYDSITLKLISFLGQCINCSFLFYSGYGIQEQLHKNRVSYCKKLMKIRFPKLLLKFVICVTLYLIMDFFLGQKYSISTIILSFVGFSSVGNSAWYIFYMFISYIGVYLSYRFFDKRRFSFCLFIGFMVIYTLLFYFLFPDKDAYYLTSLIFPLGMLVSVHKKVITEMLKKYYLFILGGGIILYIMSFIIRHKLQLAGPFYNITALFFSIILVTLTFKIKIDSRVLTYFGKNVFGIYILQRLPMIMASTRIKGGINKTNYLIVFILCFGITLLLSIIMNKLFREIHL